MSYATIPVAGVGGLPLWALLLSVLLTGGGGAALWNLLAARMASHAEREVTASTANQNDIAAMNTALTGVAAENKRLSTRLAEVDLENHRLSARLAQVEAELIAVQAELDRRPTRAELLDVNGKLRRQLLELGETPVNGTR